MPNAEAAILKNGPAMLQVQGPIMRKEFTFPGDLQSVAAAREQVMQCVRGYCTDEGDEIDLAMALQEALVNAALHGCRDDASKIIECAIEVSPKTISCVVRDSGLGFDFERVADPKRFDTTTLEHGRGIALMRSLVDEVTFSRGGSEIRFLKRMNGPADSPTG